MELYQKLKKRYDVVEEKIPLGKNIYAFVRIFTDPKCKSKTPLLMIPGGPGFGGSMYYMQVPFLTKCGPVIIIDPRDTGENSEAPIETLTMEQHIEDIETIRQHLGLNTFNLFGGSYGGIAAQGYAIRYPLHLNKLLLGVTAHNHRFIHKATQYLEQKATPEEKCLGLSILEGEIKDDNHADEIFVGLMSLYSIKMRENPALQKKLASMNRGFSINSCNKGFKEYLRTFDFSKQLDSIPCPTLVIAGKYDWICDASFSYEIAQAIPNSQLVMMPGGHRLFLDCQKMYIHTISGFLKHGLT